MNALRIGAGLAAAFLFGGTPALAQMFDGCPSQDIRVRFEQFGKTGIMPPDLRRWLGDPKAQYVEPYKAFDNVWYVGVCWVSSWAEEGSA